MVLDRPSPAPSVFISARSGAVCFALSRAVARFAKVSSVPTSLVLSSRPPTFPPLSWPVSPNVFCRTQICAALCVDSPFFATQFGAECWCGETDDYDKHGASTECNSRCRGNADEICGGVYKASVYSNGGFDPSGTPSPVEVVTTPEPIVSTEFTLLGCFNDVQLDRYCRRELLHGGRVFSI